MSPVQSVVCRTLFMLLQTIPLSRRHHPATEVQTIDPWFRRTGAKKHSPPCGDKIRKRLATNRKKKQRGDRQRHDTTPRQWLKSNTIKPHTRNARTKKHQLRRGESLQNKSSDNSIHTVRLPAIKQQQSIFANALPTPRCWTLRDCICATWEQLLRPAT